MIITLDTPATDTPVSYKEAATHLHLLDDTEQNLVETLILAMTGVAENSMNRSIMTQTWKMYLDTTPTTNEIILPYPPLQSVTSIKYTDVDGAEQTFSSDEYVVDTDSTPGRIVLAHDSTGWPAVQAGTVKIMEIEFVAGWTSSNAVPATIKAAILLLVGHLFEHREEVYEVERGEVIQLPKASEWLLFPYRIVKF